MAHLVRLLLFFIPVQLFSADFHFNDQCKKAYGEIFRFQFSFARNTIDKEKKAHPENLIPIYLENHIDFLENFFVENDPHNFKSRKDQRLIILSKGNNSSPWFLFTQAEIQLQHALFQVHQKEYFSAFFELRKAYFLFEKNLSLFPHFQPAKKSLLMIKVLLGIVPEKYQWGIRLFGMSADATDALEAMQGLLASSWNENAFLKDEAAHVLAFLLLHFSNDKTEAWGFFKKMHYPLNENLFSYYTAIYIALHTFKNDEALEWISEIPDDKNFASFPVLEYYKGIAHLQQLDERCLMYFQKFIDSRKNDDLLKSAYQKIAWAHLVEGNDQQYLHFIKLVEKNGATNTEADKQAQREAELKKIPHAELLKARLLFDGGYFSEALNILENISDEKLEPPHRLEFVYRKARVHHENGNSAKAIENYLRTFNEGKNEPYYFAANAALQLGLIYESAGEKEKAKNYFEECLQLNDHEYKVSLAQKAKAGLERLSK